MSDPIQGQGHGGRKVVKIADFNIYFLRQLMKYDIPRQYVKF